jgi:hypothetical protein
MKMPINQKIINTTAAHPKLVTFAIGLAITMAVGIAIGMFGVHTAISKDCPQHGCKGTHGYYSNQHIIFARNHQYNNDQFNSQSTH